MGEKQITTNELYDLIKGLIVSNNEIKVQITQFKEDIKGEIGAVKEELTRELQQIKEENKALKEENKLLREKLQTIEKGTKKYSLMVYNLEEKEEKYIDLQNFIDILGKFANVPCTFNDFRDFYRLGKSEGKNKARPASFEVVSCFLKEEILKNASKLKEKNIYITPDYPKEEYLDRKLLRKYLKIARSQNKHAEIKNYTLFVDGEKFTLEYLHRKEAVEVGEANKVEKAFQEASTNQKRKPENSPETCEARSTKKTTRSGRTFSSAE